MKGDRFSPRHALLAAFACGALLRAHGLGTIDLFGDEYQHIFCAIKFDGILNFLRLPVENPTHLLLDPLQTFLMARLSEDLWWLRFPSLLWGLAGIVGLWRLGLATRDRWVAAVAAGLLAVSPLHIEWSKRVDFYTVLAALAVWSTVAMLRMIDEPRAWKSYCVLNVLFLYSHPYAVVVGGLHGLFLARNAVRCGRPHTFRPFVQAWLLAGILFFPWFIISAKAMLDRHLFDYTVVRIQLPLSQFIYETPLYLSVATEFYNPFGQGGMLGGLVAVGCLGLYASSLASSWRKILPPAVLFCHMVVPLGFILVIAIDLAYHFFFAPRQLIWILPFYLLTVAHGARVALDIVCSYWGATVRKTVALGAFALFFFEVVSVQMQSTWAQERLMTGWKTISESVDKNVEREDVFLFENSMLTGVLLYHYDPAAFKSLAGVQRDKDGLHFIVPDDLRFGKFRNRGVLGRHAFAVEENISRDQIWWVRGKSYDFNLHPPVRKRKEERAALSATES